MIKSKKLVTYDKKQIVRIVAKELGITIPVLEKIYDAFGEAFRQLLATADKKTDVCIKLYKGINFECTYLPERDSFDYLNQTEIIANDRYKLKATITRYYKDKLLKDFPKPKRWVGNSFL